MKMNLKMVSNSLIEDNPAQKGSPCESSKKIPQEASRMMRPNSTDSENNNKNMPTRNQNNHKKGSLDGNNIHVQHYDTHTHDTTPHLARTEHPHVVFDLSKNICWRLPSKKVMKKLAQQHENDDELVDLISHQMAIMSAHAAHDHGTTVTHLNGTNQTKSILKNKNPHLSVELGNIQQEKTVYVRPCEQEAREREQYDLEMEMEVPHLSDDYSDDHHEECFYDAHQSISGFESTPESNLLTQGIPVLGPRVTSNLKLKKPKTSRNNNKQRKRK